jgi:hypothetical protein
MACPISVGGFGASKFGQNKFGQVPAISTLNIPLTCAINKSIALSTQINKSINITGAVNKTLCLDCKLRLT